MTQINMKKLFQKQKKGHARGRGGFTVIEAFVGISVLLIGIVGPMTLVNRNFQVSRFSRDQITAYYLAQEAVEVIRQVRDDNLLANRAWNAGLNVCRNGCVVNSQATGSAKLKTCSPSSCINDKALYLTADSKYVHTASGASATNFSRFVNLEERSDHSIIKVTVQFNTGRYQQEYITTSIITDWVQ